jgi:hypothetical protein
MSIVRTLQPPLNKAMYFDGANRYVIIPSQLNNLMGREWTVEVWVNTVLFTRTGAGFKNLFSSSSFNVFGWGLIQDTSLNRLVFITFYSGGGNTVKLDGWNAYFGTWHHVVGRYSESLGSQSLFLDGSLIGSVSPTPMAISTYAVSIGGDTVVQYVSVVRAYSRPLSDSEIRHNMSNPNNPVRDKLVLWLDARACDASKNICYDLSGNGNHGTMYNVSIVTLPNQISPGMVM